MTITVTTELKKSAAYLRLETAQREREELCVQLRKAQEVEDFWRGYNERLSGYYDKWYRYNRTDCGRAYDLGVKEAAKRSDLPDSFTLIECVH